MPASGQWSFDAFSYAVNNIATYDSTFVPSVFDAFVNAAVKTNSLQVINNVLPVQVTSITQLQQLAITLPTVDLLPAIVALSTLVGKETTLAIAESYREPNKKHSQTNWREKTDELAERNIHITFSNEVKEYILEKGYEVKYGARPLRRAIQKYIENELAESLLRNELLPNDSIIINLENDKVVLTR